MIQFRPGLVVGGKLELVSELGVGGMGAVWKARDTRLLREVAVKFIRPELLGEADARIALTRFEREARAAARLRTRHVAQIFDLGLEGTTPYLVMELLTGESVNDRIHRFGRLSVADTARIGRETCRALTEAHEAQIIHRDLKPSNLFLTMADGAEIVKVIDFGVAKSGQTMSEAATRTGSVVGTPHFMSPEYLMGNKADPSTDLWALTVILYSCLTGSRPFEGAELSHVILAIADNTPKRPRERRPDLPESVDAFFARALHRDPARRFQTAAEMAAALDRLEAPAPPPPVELEDEDQAPTVMERLRVPPIAADPPTYIEPRHLPAAEPRIDAGPDGEEAPTILRPKSVTPAPIADGEDGPTLANPRSPSRPSHPAFGYGTPPLASGTIPMPPQVAPAAPAFAPFGAPAPSPASPALGRPHPAWNATDPPTMVPRSRAAGAPGPLGAHPIRIAVIAGVGIGVLVLLVLLLALPGK